MKDEVKQAQRAKRVAEGHQLEIGAQRAPRFLVFYNSSLFSFIESTCVLWMFHAGGVLTDGNLI